MNPPQAGSRPLPLSPESVGISTPAVVELRCGTARSDDRDLKREPRSGMLAPFEALAFAQTGAKIQCELRFALSQHPIRED